MLVVCDSLCLERNLNLVLQILEITNNVIVIVNLLDEAKKKNVNIDLELLEEKLGVKVVGTAARSKQGINQLLESIAYLNDTNSNAFLKYDDFVEERIQEIEKNLKDINVPKRWLAVRILENDPEIIKEFDEYIDNSLISCDNTLRDYFVLMIANKSVEIAQTVVSYNTNKKDKRERKIDYLLTNKYTGIPIMIILMMFIFWLTITGANYTSQLLFHLFAHIENFLNNIFNYVNSPIWIREMLVGGVFKTLSWVVAVMLPPMAIFFPLFTILED